MNLLLIAAILLQITLPFPGPGMPAAAGSTASFVNATGCRGASVTNCTTPAINVTAGHAIAFCTQADANATVSAFAPSTGTNTLASFTTLFTPSAGASSFDCRYLLSTNASGSTTFTVTWSATTALNLLVYEIIAPTGLDATPPAINIDNSAGHTTITCPNYTTAHANALVICAGMSSSSATSYTASSGFTIPTGGENLAGGGSTGAMEYQFAPTLGSAFTPSMTVAALSNGSFASSFAFF